MHPFTKKAAAFCGGSEWMHKHHNIYRIAYFRAFVKNVLNTLTKICVLYKKILLFSYKMPIDFSKKTCYNIDKKGR